MSHSILINLKSIALLSTLFIYGCIEDSKFQSGINTEYMDTQVDPGDNFMNYANGTWLKNTAIPNDRTQYGIGHLVDERINARIKIIIESCASGGFVMGSDEQIVGDYYQSFIDVETRNKKGISPLQSDIDKIDAISNYNELVTYFAYANKIGVETPLQLHIWPDLKDATRYNVYIQQSGLGLPEREYYFNSDNHSVHLRAKYLEFMQSSLQILDIENPSSTAEEIFLIEKRLAENYMKKEETRMYTKLYNVYDVKELIKLMPNFNWVNYLEEAGLKNRDSVVIEMIDYTMSLNSLINEIEITNWQNYLKWSLFRNMSSRLSENINELYFNFKKELFGFESQPPLWERGIRNVNDDLGQLIIKLYGEKHVSDKAIEEVYEMIENIKQAFRESIQESNWMEEETRKEMLKKLNAISAAVVYQKKWKDYSNLGIKRDDYFGNKKKYNLNEYQYALGNLDKQINKDETEIRINSARYDPSLNMFILGAGYITAPYYDTNSDAAANFGALGNTIGHEIGHAFDRLGAEFDSEGNVRNWWTEKDKSAFEKISQTLVNQFNQFEVLENLYINGEHTLNENMADLTGLVIPLRAYKKTLKKGGAGPVIDGFNGIQRFFIAYAQTWMYKAREEYLKRQVSIDPHAPAKYRVNGIVNNVGEFYNAFNLNADDTLFLEPSDRVKLW